MQDSLRQTLKEMRTMREGIPFPVKLYISSSLEAGGAVGDSVETAVKGAISNINRIEGLRSIAGASLYQVGVGVLYRVDCTAVLKPEALILGAHKEISNTDEDLDFFVCYNGQVSRTVTRMLPTHLLIFAEEERLRIACKGDIERYLGTRVMQERLEL